MMDNELSQERFEELKAEYRNRITENGTCSDDERQRINLRKLREELNEYAERRNTGLSDFDEYADDYSRQRNLARIEFRRRALADVVDEIIDSAKLSPLDEATHNIRKKLDVSYKTAVIPAAIFRATVRTILVIGTVAMLCIGAFYFTVGGKPPLSVGGYFAFVGTVVEMLFSGERDTFVVWLPLVSLTIIFWLAFFNLYRQRS